MPSWGVFRGTPRTVHKIYLMMATAIIHTNKKICYQYISITLSLMYF